MKHWVTLLFVIALSGCTHFRATKVVTSSEVVDRAPVGSPYTEETTESQTNLSTKTEDDVDIHGNLVTEGKGHKNTTTVKRTRCLQEFNVSTRQTYDMEYRLVNRGLDFAGGAILALVGVGAILVGLPGRDFVGNRRPASIPMFVIGGLAIGGGGVLFGHAIVKGNKPPPDPERGLSETIQGRQISEVDTCPGFGPKTVAEVPPPAAATAAAPPEDDIAARLKRLDELHASGVITEEEYKKRRAELVDQL